MSEPLSAAEACFSQKFETYLPGYATRRSGARDLLAMTKTALLAGLKITDELPRSHWVWQPGYAVQTVNMRRLGDLCTFRLREDPSDELALWIRIGMAFIGGPDFDRDAFRLLKHRNGFDAAWPVYAACFVQTGWGEAQHVELGAFLRESGLLQEAGATISALRELRDPYVDVFEVEGFSRESAAECLEIVLWEHTRPVCPSGHWRLSTYQNRHRGFLADACGVRSRWAFAIPAGVGGSRKSAVGPVTRSAGLEPALRALLIAITSAAIKANRGRPGDGGRLSAAAIATTK
jgi:hypothetical protein